MPIATILLLALPLAADPASPPRATAAATRMLGELALARDALGFAPCGGDAAAAHGAGAASGAAALVAGLNAGADGSVFVDVDAARGPDGAWRIERVRRAYRRGPRCTEDLGEFVWRGELAGDGWTFNASRRYVALRRPGQRALFFRYRPFEQTADGAWRFSAQADGVRIDIGLRGERCRSPDGAALTDWALELTLDGESRQGCAWSGEPR